MDSILQESGVSGKKSFLAHVFSTTEEGKAEVLNVVQYAVLGVIPVVILNKLIQRFIPEADSDKSSLELLVEIFLQILIIFCGLIVVHRIITYIPTYSGFKYENLTLTNVILAFLVIVLSIQTKLGLKVNILVDRLGELWNGPEKPKKRVATSSYSTHSNSQADYLDSVQMQGPDVFPPAPVAVQKPMQIQASPSPTMNDFAGAYLGPVAANTILGGSFGSLF
jgi:hypothetical protein